MPNPDQHLSEFYKRLWKQRILPQLAQDQEHKQARRTRRVARWASASGRMLDSFMGLRGHPFTRALTSLGVDLSFPQNWEWDWLGRQNESVKSAIQQEAERAARRLEFAEALSLFGLNLDSPEHELKAAWREAAHRWHPDRARSEVDRQQSHCHFITLQAAYEQLQQAYADGKLPVCENVTD